MNIDNLDVWACAQCDGDGWYWKLCQVADRKTDTQEIKTHCDECEGLGYVGPDASKLTTDDR